MCELLCSLVSQCPGSLGTNPSTYLPTPSLKEGKSTKSAVFALYSMWPHHRYGQHWCVNFLYLDGCNCWGSCSDINHHFGDTESSHSYKIMYATLQIKLTNRVLMYMYIYMYTITANRKSGRAER